MPAENLVGSEGRAFAMVMSHFDYSRAAIGLQCLGASRASLEETYAYVRHRQAFGQPIAAFQGVPLPLAEHATLVDAARWACYRTLWLRQASLPHTAEAAMCKWWAPVVAKNAIEVCLLTHVHYGTAQIQKQVIASRLIGPEVRGR